MRGAVHGRGSTIGLDIAKSVFQVHGIDADGAVDCGPAMKDGKMTAGEAAGPHFDPEAKKSHKGPKGVGHKGDLPLLNARDKGINQTVAVARLKLSNGSSTKAATTIATTRRTAAARVVSLAVWFQSSRDGAHR